MELLPSAARRRPTEIKMKTNLAEEPILETSASPVPQREHAPLTVEVFRDLKDLARVKNEWVTLQQHPNCDFDFYSGVVSSTESILRPHVIVVSRDGQPITMLIGRIDRGTVDFQIGYKKVFGFAAKNLTFLHGGFVGEKSAEITRVLIDSLSESLRKGEADVCYFNHLRADEDLFQQLSAINLAKATLRVRPCESTAELRLQRAARVT